jgi:hypothetical protein
LSLKTLDSVRRCMGYRMMCDLMRSPAAFVLFADERLSRFNLAPRRCR